MSPGERVRDHQWRGGEKIHAHFRMHATLEVAVAREHRAGGEIARLDRGGDLRLQRAAVADAVMDRYTGGHEGVQLVDRKVEHGVLSRRTTFRDSERESGQRHRILRGAVALRVLHRIGAVRRAEPRAYPHLLE